MRIPLFIGVFLSFLIVTFVYLGFQLAFAPWVWFVLALPYAGVAIYPVIVLGKRRGRGNSPGSPDPSFLQWMSYFSMAYLSFLGPLAVARNIAWLVVLRVNETNAAGIDSPLVSLALVVLSFIALVLGLWIAQSGPRVHEVEVAIENLPQALDGFRIAQISDLHVGPTVRANYVRRVTEKTNAANADLVVLTGDIGDGPLDDFKKDAAPLAELAPQGRVYLCPGNHEYYWGGEVWLKHFAEMGMLVLRNQHEILNHKGAAILIAGVLDPAAAVLRANDGPNPELAMSGGEAADFKLLLAHQPGIAERAEKVGFSLQLSGHTHGGQFFPWTLVVRQVHKFHQGLFTLRRMKIYVSPGTGSWGPPVRLGTRPEISLLTLRRAR